MTKTEIAILAGAAGLLVGFGVGYIVVKQACKDRIVSGVEGAAKSLGVGTTVQQLIGQGVRELLERAN